MNINLTVLILNRFLLFEIYEYFYISFSKFNIIFVMKRKNQTIIHLLNYSLYKVITSNGWSIVIMDDNILFDNYHERGVHVHYNPHNHKDWIKIKEYSVDELFLIIKTHIINNGKLNLEKLLQEVRL